MSYKTLKIHFIRPDDRKTTEHFFGDDLNRTIESLKAYDTDSNKLDFVVNIGDRPAKFKFTTKLSEIAQKGIEEITIRFVKKPNQRTNPI